MRVRVQLAFVGVTAVVLIGLMLFCTMRSQSKVWLPSDSRTPEYDSSNAETLRRTAPIGVQHSPSISADSGDLEPIPEKVVISGRVVDYSGAGVSGALLFVDGLLSPEAEMSPCRKYAAMMDPEGGTRVGWLVHADNDGRFEAKMAEDNTTGCLVWCMDSAGYEVTDFRPFFVQNEPAYVCFVVKRNAAATVEVAVTESGKLADDREFRVCIADAASDRVKNGTTVKGEYRAQIEIDDPLGEVLVTVTVFDTQNDDQRSTRELLRAGGDRKLSFEFAPSPSIAGRVVDEVGRPIAGAKLFWGSSWRLRGEGLRVVEFESLPSGAVSEPNGDFRLNGTGDAITAIHPEYSFAEVVRPENGLTITLAQRCELVLICRAGHEAECCRHRARIGRGQVVDFADRRVHFRSEIAGVHLIEVFWDDGPSESYCVEALAGQVTEIELFGGSRQSLSMPIPAGIIDGDGTAPRAVAVGADAPHRFVVGQIQDDRCLFEGATPGDYWVIFSSGAVYMTELSLQVARNRDTRAVGSYIEVRGSTRDVVYPFPLRLPALYEGLFMRLVARGIESNSLARFGPLPPGEYEVRSRDSGLIEEVQLGYGENRTVWR